jgi:hypothetical protein
MNDIDITRMERALKRLKEARSFVRGIEYSDPKSVLKLLNQTEEEMIKWIQEKLFAEMGPAK